MARSIKKGPFQAPSLLNKIAQMETTGKKKAIKTWSRASMIGPSFIGYTFNVHNGKIHIPVYVTKDMVGHKLGEFAPTRRFTSHSENRTAKGSGEAGKK